MTDKRKYITPKQRFMKELDKAIEEGKGFVTTTELGKIPGDEYTINLPQSLPFKKLHFENSYNSELKLKNDERVKITRYMAIDYTPGRENMGNNLP